MTIIEILPWLMAFLIGVSSARKLMSLKMLDTWATLSGFVIGILFLLLFFLMKKALVAWLDKKTNSNLKNKRKRSEDVRP
jgi:hypothetical protein